MAKSEKKKKGSVNVNIDVKAIGKTLAVFFNHHGPVLFIILSFGLLIYSVYTVNNILTSTDDENYRTEKESTTIQTHFEKNVIEKIAQLKADQQSPNITLPTGRINPFSE